MPPAQGALPKVGWLINRNFALLWSGQAISMIGDWLFDSTLIIWIAAVLARNQPWAPIAVSGVLVATSLPFFLVGPFAGVFVDRWDKRQTMLRMDAIRAILILLLLVVAGGVSLPFLSIGRLALAGQLGAIYVTVFLTNLCAQFFRPAQMALLGDIVPEPYRVRASGLSEMTANFALIIGPSLAAPLFFASGVQWALLVDALSFVVSFATIFAIHPPPAARSIEADQETHFLGEFSQGLRFYFSNRILTTILISFVVVMLGAGAFNALAIFFITDNLRADPAWYGPAVAVVGGGIIAGALLGTALAKPIGMTRLFWLSLLALGVSVLVLARQTNLVAGMVLYFLFGMAQGPGNVVLTPLVLHVTPRELVGRVTAVLEPAIMLASVLSMVVVGALDSTVLAGFHATILGIRFGPVDTIYTVMALLTILAGIYAMLRLRGVQIKTEQAPDEAEPEPSLADAEQAGVQG
jgi:MFS family permease